MALRLAAQEPLNGPGGDQPYRALHRVCSTEVNISICSDDKSDMELRENHICWQMSNTSVAIADLKLYACKSGSGLRCEHLV
jgi:hypothetical protein